ncbi:MAG: ParB/Srx family N-terminal domain-containing protein [Alphaproteobacteria bacterium]|nr:ParB/Srx family N-terminal domain-containing protein [Alphaproteobacteria bacterium]
MDAKLPRMAERIEFWETEKLKPYEKNPRLHSDEQISQLAASFIRFGMVMPILVDKEAGVIAGHGRLEAAKLVGLEKIPVVVLDNLTDEEKRAYVIADNKLAENASWDKELLGEHVELLMAKDFDMGVVGFSEDELEQLLLEAQDDLSDGFDDDNEGHEVQDESDTQCVVGSYRIPIPRADYLRWHDAIRSAVGFEKESIKNEIKRRLKI